MAKKALAAVCTYRDWVILLRGDFNGSCAACSAPRYVTLIIITQTQHRNHCLANWKHAVCAKARKCAALLTFQSWWQLFQKFNCFLSSNVSRVRPDSGMTLPGASSRLKSVHCDLVVFNANATMSMRTNSTPWSVAAWKCVGVCTQCTHSIWLICMPKICKLCVPNFKLFKPKFNNSAAVACKEDYNE